MIKGNETNNSIYGCLLFVFFMVIVTLSQPIMAWVWILCLCTFTIAIIRIKRNLPSIKNITLNLLAIFCMLLLIYLSSNFGLMATMVNLLVVAACLKLINLRNHADYYVVLIVLFFLIACGFVYHQSIYVVAYYFACLVLLFVTAFLLNKGSLDITQSIAQSSKMILQALPIMMILFIVTPRLPPFWQTSVESNTQTGLSEELTPGDIANLAQSSDLVFRAEFDNNVPIPQARYWRSIVLDHFDGKTWRTSTEDISYQESTPIYTIVNETDSGPATDDVSLRTKTDYRYLIIAQPNNTKWLYSLDIPFVEESIGALEIYTNRQYQLFQSQIPNSSSLYIVRSNTQAPLRNFTPRTDFTRYLQTPTNSNERTQAWVKANINATMTFSEKLATLNGYFTQQPFTYTLKPPLMQTSPIDMFLFDNQQGFCSHYASALTYMLRLSDIPARMVAGYQGGEEQGNNILTVRQYDAHAWVEAYNEDQGWIRFDPTSLVAPNRTLAGLMAALSEQDNSVFDDEINGLFSHSMFDGFRETFAMVDHTWNQFFLEFNNDSQGGLIEDIFGELSKRNLTTFLLIALAFIALFLALLFLPYKKWLRFKRRTALQKLLALLTKKGFARHSHEPLEQFFTRIEPTLPNNMSLAVKVFVSQYYSHKYSPHSQVSEADLNVLFTKVASTK